jgi:hypothetical protein
MTWSSQRSRRAACPGSWSTLTAPRSAPAPMSCGRSAVSTESTSATIPSRPMAQTGQILCLRNRPGSVHDSTQATVVVWELIDSVRAGLGRVPSNSGWARPTFSATSCACSPRAGAPMPSRSATGAGSRSSTFAAECRDWAPLGPSVAGFEHRLTIPQWRPDVRVMIYRKHVHHRIPKNFRLDLFTPDDDRFEYYAVVPRICRSPCQPSSPASSPWPWCPPTTTAPTGLAATERGRPQPRPQPSTRHPGRAEAPLARTDPCLPVRSMRTPRFLPIARAGRVTRIAGRSVLHSRPESSGEQTIAGRPWAG